ncbi:hypothetical protein NDU88_007163 [Pleurodeles waltl]|uniref:Uncharacterized protein n=1 Tax=Pleurodeles waltl TaxID=8319 RepID=A0AAV7QR28_PLEWA|nr:hypothetical protein NDU88_007163 [Pleurodeles waltl]
MVCLKAASERARGERHQIRVLQQGEDVHGEAKALDGPESGQAELRARPLACRAASPRVLLVCWGQACKWEDYWSVGQ